MNKRTYDELCKYVEKKPIDTWYLKTEKIFQTREIKNEDEFLKLVAFAYSWMPTIPKWSRNFQWGTCKTLLTEFRTGDSRAFGELLQLLVPNLNNSLVGASKVLHFACPKRAQIIDSNVVIAWRALFFPNGIRGNTNETVAAIPSDFGKYGSNTVKRNRHIDLYMKYCENLQTWSKALDNVSERDIELKLYLRGRQIRKKKAKRASRAK